MASLHPRYSKQEFRERGDAIYLRDISPRMTPADQGKFVAIDIESGDFELDANDFKATERLLQRRPDAQMWLARVGRRAAYRIGGRPGGSTE